MKYKNFKCFFSLALKEYYIIRSAVKQLSEHFKDLYIIRMFVSDHSLMFDLELMLGYCIPQYILTLSVFVIEIRVMPLHLKWWARNRKVFC